ncbi:MAG: phosphate signaling complex protein PhoU [Intestinimonas sp.]|jgi:phosphate transport system protein|nr:phosphate signaling complex protein PhoU [Intestinimonas sp.]
MRKTFDAELLELNEELTGMAMAAQDAIDVVTKSLSSNDEAEARSVIEMTATLSQSERDIENRCLRLLLRQQPVARDLRAISAAMKMVTDLQRIGDQASNIAELSLLLGKRDGDSVVVPNDIGVMACKAGLMVRQAISAYTARDVETAHAVVNLDDEVDDLFQAVKGELIDRVVSSRKNADQAIDLIIIAKYLERVADHAVNIAQWAVFCVTGEL